MGYLKYAGYAALFATLLFVTAGSSKAQVVVGVGVGPVYGPPPVCAYGYYSYYPYDCAPYGYWGPDYFVDGIFIGAGPWFHGFYGRGYYGRGFYGRGYYGHGFYGRGFSGRGYYGRGFAGRPGYAYRGGVNRGFVGGGFHGGAQFHGGGGGFHGGGGFRGGSGGFRGGAHFGGHR